MNEWKDISELTVSQIKSGKYEFKCDNGTIDDAYNCVETNLDIVFDWLKKEKKIVYREKTLPELTHEQIMRLWFKVLGEWSRVSSFEPHSKNPYRLYWGDKYKKTDLLALEHAEIPPEAKALDK